MPRCSTDLPAKQIDITSLVLTPAPNCVYRTGMAAKNGRHPVYLKLLRDGKTITEVAKLFGVSKQAVWNAKARWERKNRKVA